MLESYDPAYLHDGRTQAEHDIDSARQALSVWHADANGVVYNEFGMTLGDGQSSGEWSVRLVRDDVPTAFIEVTTAVTINLAGRYSPETQIEYLIGTDPDDVAGSDVWSDIESASDHLYDYADWPEAKPFAERSTRYYADKAGEIFNWDGVTRRVN